jgi:hypothetical protein
MWPSPAVQMYHVYVNEARRESQGGRRRTEEEVGRRKYLDLSKET